MGDVGFKHRDRLIVNFGNNIGVVLSVLNIWLCCPIFCIFEGAAEVVSMLKIELWTEFR